MLNDQVKLQFMQIILCYSKEALDSLLKLLFERHTVLFQMLLIQKSWIHRDRIKGLKRKRLKLLYN